MARIGENEKEFKNFLDNEMSSDVLNLTLKVLTNICRANFNEKIIQILTQVCSKKFLDNLKDYLMKLFMENSSDKSDNQIYHEDIARYI